MNDTPWFVPSCIDFLESLVDKDTFAFEWGCGGSTIWLSKRCKAVVSIEHNKAWAEKVSGLWLENVDIRLIESEGHKTGDKSDIEGGWSSCLTGNFLEYAGIVGLYHPDIVIVDGRARATCLNYGAIALKSGGWLVLDNAEREWYTENASFLDDWEKVEFSEGEWKTWFWRKPEK